MNFLKFDVGMLNTGRAVEVTLSGDAANVRLLDEVNLYKYARGGDYSFTGGLVKRSPVRIKIPGYAHWFVVVDMKGLSGVTDASVRVV